MLCAVAVLTISAGYIFIGEGFTVLPSNELIIICPDGTCTKVVGFIDQFLPSSLDKIVF
jgi:hypothetical protein